MKKWERPDIKNLKIKATYESPTNDVEVDALYIATENGVKVVKGQIQGHTDGSGPVAEIQWNQQSNG